jgi:saccharopine dehydrogenase (NADP+, L-glutamate forming)
VHAAPSDPALVSKWMGEIDKLAQHLQVVDQTA